MKTHIPFALSVAALVAVAPAAGQEVQVGPDRYAVHLRSADLHPTTRGAARRIFARIGRAAMAVCGASDVSLYEVKQSVRHSACWHDSVADAVRRIDNPLLSQTWKDYR